MRIDSISSFCVTVIDGQVGLGVAQSSDHSENLVERVLYLLYGIPFIDVVQGVSICPRQVYEKIFKQLFALGLGQRFE